MMTVVIATRNGSRTLPDVLGSYRRVKEPDGGWKLIIVDNASTDGTRDIVDSYLSRLPLTCLYEGQPGKNAALNTALGHVDGDLVVFTDDDVFPSPEWLARLRSAADAHPSYTIFGGVISPRWESPPPDWILELVPLDVVFALSSPGLEEGPTTPDKIFGPNMAVRAEVFQKGFRFDVSIGPRGTKYAQGSETEFLKRLGREKYAAWNVNDAEVEHFIRDYQLRQSWILERAIRFGRGQYRLNHSGKSDRMASWFGIPRHLFRELIEQTARALACMIAFDRKNYFRARWDLNYCRGNILEAWNLRK